jgi:hypothetical protein
MRLKYHQSIFEALSWQIGSWLMQRVRISLIRVA